MERHRTEPRGQIAAQQTVRMAHYYRLLLLFLMFVPAVGNAAIEMETAPGLGGRVVTDKPTELRIRLHANVDAIVELQFRDANGENSLTLEIDAQAQTILWLPVRPESGRPLSLRLLASDGQVSETRQVFEHRQAPITLVSRSVPAGRAPGDRPAPFATRPVIVAPNGFPHSLAAYAGVGAIVTDSASLSRLSTVQYRALAKYLGGCNPLLLAATSPATLQRIRELSGCGGSYVRSYESLQQVYSLLRQLDSERPHKMPAAEELLTLGLPLFRAEMAASLTLYLTGYVVFMALLAARMKKTQYLLALPVVVAAAGVLAWHGDGSARLFTWAETQSGDSYMRLSGLLLLGGDRRGRGTQAVASGLSWSSANAAATGGYRRGSSGASRSELSARTDLLTPAVYLLDGVGRQSPPFTLQLKQGRPELTSRQREPVHGARLLWQGYSYPVPALGRGESWQPPQSRGELPGTAEEKLLRRRLEFDAPALLMPHRQKPQDLDDIDADSPGWLVIRHNPGQVL